MSTPALRRALKALARAKARNLRRIARGDKPVLNGERVSLATFNRRTGAGITREEARRRLREG